MRSLKKSNPSYKILLLGQVLEYGDSPWALHRRLSEGACCAVYIVWRGHCESLMNCAMEAKSIVLIVNSKMPLQNNIDD